MTWLDEMEESVASGRRLSLISSTRMIHVVRDLVVLIQRICEVEEIDDLYHSYKRYMRCHDVYELLRKEK